MKIKLISSVVITIFFLLFFKSIEKFFINSGMSWTFSKISPYFLLVIAGIYLSTRAFNSSIQKKMIRYVLGTTLFILPFTIGFLLHPIYQGDFSKEGSLNIVNHSPSDIVKDGLMVITIPNCPYCFESIKKLKLIKQRNPSLNIEFVVCTTDKEYIKTYVTESEGKFDVRIAKQADSLAATAGFRFPVFVQVKNKKPIYSWSNDQFGVRAIDMLEESIQ